MVKKLTTYTGAIVLILFALICLKEGTLQRSNGKWVLSESSLKRAFDKGVAKPIGGMAEEVSPARSERK
jgi:hypothetical protein